MNRVGATNERTNLRSTLAMVIFVFSVIAVFVRGALSGTTPNAGSNGDLLLVVNKGDRTLSIVDSESGSQLAAVPVGGTERARIRDSGRLEYPHVSGWRSSCPQERRATIARKGDQRSPTPGYGHQGSPGDPAPLRRYRPPRRNPTSVRRSARHRGSGAGC